MKLPGVMATGGGCVRWRRAWQLPALLVLSIPALSQVITYEGDEFPDNQGWTSVRYCDPGRALVAGWFEQEVEPCPTDPPPGGRLEANRRGLGSFIDKETFFLEWRAETSGPASEIVGTAPASMAVGDDTGVTYHFTFATDQLRMIRDNLLPILVVGLPEVPHTYRLELDNTGPTYALYIDGQEIESGVAEGVFPQIDSAIVSFRAKSWYESSVTRWDFVRLGRIPQDASGDYDSDGEATLFDYYFVHDCLTKAGPGIFGGPSENAGPGCRFADFPSDGEVHGDVDLLDFAEFQNLFGASSE